MTRLPPLLLLLLAACSDPALPRAAPPSAPPRVGQPPDRQASVATRAEELESLLIPRRPAWTDRSYQPGPAQRRFVITALMQRYQLDRAHAVELQNHYRDLAAADPHGDRTAHFQTALARVRAGAFEDRRDLERLALVPFIIVFDLDETLYDQYYPAAVAQQCHDLEVTTGGGERRYIELDPGWNEVIDDIIGLGGAVVIFTANTDVNFHENAAAWQLDGQPLLASPKISGFLTNSHLIQQQSSEGGEPVQEPSKDLRIIDPSLRRVVLVDDNPKRVFQYRNLRLFKRFDAEAYCTGAEPELEQAYAQSLRQVGKEIAESVRYRQAHGGDFAAAYLPFTMLGQIAVTFLEDTMGLSRREAIRYVRTHPSVVDENF